METSKLLVVFIGMIIVLVDRKASSQLPPVSLVPPMPPLPPIPPNVPPPLPLSQPVAPPAVPRSAVVPPSAAVVPPAPAIPPAAALPPLPPMPPNSVLFGPNGMPRYEIDKDSYYYDPTKDPAATAAQKQNATEPQLRYRYEYDFIEPDPTTRAPPIYIPKAPVYVPPPQTNYIAPPKKAPVFPTYRPTQRPVYTPQTNLVNPYKYQQLLRLKQRQQLLRARQLAALAQRRVTPLYSPYPIRDFLRIAQANRIKCYTLYDVYGIKPRTSYASICGQKASCPYPYVKPVQVGQICICCTNFTTLGSYVTVVRPATTSNQGNNNSGD